MSLLKKRMIPVTAHSDGELTDISPFNTIVEKYDPVAVLLQRDGGQIDITAPVPGYVSPVAKLGTVTRGELVAYIITTMEHMPDPRPLIRRGSVRPKEIADEQAPVDEQASGVVGDEPVGEPPGALHNPPATFTLDIRPDEYKTVNWTVTVTPFHRRGTQELQRILAERGINYSVAELSRLAFHMMLATPYDVLVGELQGQRNFERDHHYGTGTRPMKRPRKKARPI
jgi:hypothetical protein